MSAEHSSVGSTANSSWVLPQNSTTIPTATALIAGTLANPANGSAIDSTNITAAATTITSYSTVNPGTANHIDIESVSDDPFIDQIPFAQNSRAQRSQKHSIPNSLLIAASKVPPDWPTLIRILQGSPKEVVHFLFPQNINSLLAGRGLIHLAALHGKPSYVELLLARGADPCLRDSNGETPLHLASRHGKLSVVDVILRVNPRAVVEVDKDSWTPLHSAAEQGHVPIVLALVGAGADVNARCKLGGTPLFLAAMEGCEDVAQLLLNAGTRNYKAYRGDTPADIAEEHGHVDLASQLYAHFSNAPSNIGSPDLVEDQFSSMHATYDIQDDGFDPPSPALYLEDNVMDR